MKLVFTNISRFKSTKTDFYNLSLLAPNTEEEIFSESFFLLDSDLQVELVNNATANRMQVYGPDFTDPSTGAYHVIGNLFETSGEYTIRVVELNKERFDLRQNIENVINDMRSLIPEGEEVQIRFESKVRKPSVMIEGDKERILQVVSNLLNNAIKFTEEGEVVVVLDEKDGQAIVSVRDTGSGIAPEIYPNLFTKFITKSEKGTGLGLFIAKNIVEAHGGKIWATNNSEGRGAIFTFMLPIST